MAFIVFIMGLKFNSSLYDLSVEGMLYVVLDGNNDRLIHFVTYDLAGTCFSKISFQRLFLPTSSIRLLL
jgi:hypothetical protein